MPSYKQIKEFIQTAKGEEIPKNTILIPDWLTWMFHYIDFWSLVSRNCDGITLFVLCYGIHKNISGVTPSYLSPANLIVDQWNI